MGLPFDGSYEAANWPLDSKVIRFKAISNVKNIFGFFIEIFQPPFISPATNILHAVTTHMIFLTLLRLSMRRERFNGMYVMHFIGLGRALGSSGFITKFIRLFLKLIWASRRRKNLTYRCIYLNENDFSVLKSVFGTKDIEYCKIPGAGIRKERFHFHKKSLVKPIKLLFLGRLIKEKGVENFINLIADIKKHTDIPVIGDIVGGFEKPNYERKIKKIIKAKKLVDTVKFIGEVKSPSSYFQKSHFFIFPSYYGEGVPTVLLESQYCGTPCLASNIAGCREAVLDGVTGRLVPSASNEDWLSEFIKILEEMDYQEMNIQAHKWVSDKFDAEYLSSKTIDWLIKEFENDKGVNINAFLN